MSTVCQLQPGQLNHNPASQPDTQGASPSDGDWHAEASPCSKSARSEAETTNTDTRTGTMTLIAEALADPKGFTWKDSFDYGFRKGSSTDLGNGYSLEVETGERVAHQRGGIRNRVPFSEATLIGPNHTPVVKVTPTTEEVQGVFAAVESQPVTWRERLTALASLFPALLREHTFAVTTAAASATLIAGLSVTGGVVAGLLPPSPTLSYVANVTTVGGAVLTGLMGLIALRDVFGNRNG